MEHKYMLNYHFWGPFLKGPDNFSGPELYFKIKIYRVEVLFLAHKPARFVSSA